MVRQGSEACWWPWWYCALCCLLCVGDDGRVNRREWDRHSHAPHLVSEEGMGWRMAGWVERVCKGPGGAVSQCRPAICCCYCAVANFAAAMMMIMLMMMIPPKKESLFF